MRLSSGNREQEQLPQMSRSDALKILEGFRNPSEDPTALFEEFSWVRFEKQNPLIASLKRIKDRYPGLVAGITQNMVKQEEPATVLAYTVRYEANESGTNSKGIGVTVDGLRLIGTFGDGKNFWWQEAPFYLMPGKSKLEAAEELGRWVHSVPDERRLYRGDTRIITRGSVDSEIFRRVGINLETPGTARRIIL